MNSLALALNFAAFLAYLERAFAELGRFASELIENLHASQFCVLASNRTDSSASGDTAKGISWIEQGIRDLRATGTVLALPGRLARKAEALHLAGRTSESLEAISEQKHWLKDLENGGFMPN